MDCSDLSHPPPSVPCLPSNAPASDAAPGGRPAVLRRAQSPSDGYEKEPESGVVPSVFYSSLTRTFHRKLNFFTNSVILAARIYKGLRLMSNCIRQFNVGRYEIPYTDFILYLAIDSLHDIDWNSLNCAEISYMNFEKGGLDMKDGSFFKLQISGKCDFVEDNDPILTNRNSSLILKFAQFQYILHKIILPTDTNEIHVLNSKEEYSDTESTVIRAKMVNNYLFEYASANVKYLLEYEENSRSTEVLPLDIDNCQFHHVIEVSSQVYVCLVVTLHDVIARVTPKVSLLPLPDYVRLRLLFEVTAHLYWARMTCKNEFSRHVRTVEAASYLWTQVSRMLDNEIKMEYFVNLREDYKALALIQLTFALIRFAHNLV